MGDPRGTARAGRPSVTTRERLERVGLALFVRDGFERTTVEDIAAAAGIGRRTFFRYYASKNDLLWGDFETGLERLRAQLAAADPGRPLLETLHRAVLDFNRLAPEAVPAHRERMALILRVPALQAHGTLRYASWRAVIAEFVAGRLGSPPDDLLPQLVGHLCLGAALTAYEQWLERPGSALDALLDRAMRGLDGAWGGLALVPAGA